uniref:HDC10340 n=1 Tax=Drosophila melanogaster TaxID=7227 RepID=Q6IL54_DROME|nr:TPA_inf: HDC10340 [Drosophila melanogaster]
MARIQDELAQKSEGRQAVDNDVITIGMLMISHQLFGVRQPTLMSWSEASTCQKNEQTAEANIECPVARLLSPVSGYPMADARIPESPLILYPAGQSPVSGISYRYQLPPLGVKLHYGQSKYKWEIEYIFVHSIYRFIRRQTKIADSFEPAFCRVRAYTKSLSTSRCNGNLCLLRPYLISHNCQKVARTRTDELRPSGGVYLHLIPVDFLAKRD